MNKTYQPFIEDMADQFINLLEEKTKFFTEEHIENKDFSKEHLCDKLTDKFVIGELSSSNNEIINVFTEEEFNKILNEIIVQNSLSGLIEKGMVDRYDDEGEYYYFLTDKGKEYAKTHNVFGIENNEKK